jgi:hypothetical protein
LRQVEIGNCSLAGRLNLVRGLSLQEAAGTAVVLHRQRCFSASEPRVSNPLAAEVAKKPPRLQGNPCPGGLPEALRKPKSSHASRTVTAEDRPELPGFRYFLSGLRSAAEDLTISDECDMEELADLFVAASRPSASANLDLSASTRVSNLTHFGQTEGKN